MTEAMPPAPGNSVPPQWVPPQSPPGWTSAPTKPAALPAAPPFDLRPTSRSALAVAGALILITAIAALMTMWPAARTTSQVPGSSAEATFRGWASAMEDFDVTQADSYLSDRLKAQNASSVDLAVCGKLTSVDVASAVSAGSRSTLVVALNFDANGGQGRKIAWTVDMVTADGMWKIDTDPGRLACY